MLLLLEGVLSVEDQDALVIFLSDHGEEVNDVREIVGHGDESSAWQSDEMIHTLLDLMKIRVPQYEKEKSLLFD